MSVRSLDTENAGGDGLYAWRHARGLCTVYEAPADGARCDGCKAAAWAKGKARDAARAKLGAELAPRIEVAVKTGRGVRLTAAEVRTPAGGAT